MVCYPEVQKKAQAELDKALKKRLPEHNDLPSLPYLSALAKEVYRYVVVRFEQLLLPVNCVPRWEPVTPLGRPLFSSNKVTSWHLFFVKASRISRPTMIFTTTIISPLTLSWSPTNGDGRLPLNIEFSSFPKLYSIGQCCTTKAIIQNRTNSNPSAFWRTENSTIQLETRWTLHSGSVGGEHYLFLISPCLIV